MGVSPAALERALHAFDAFAVLHGGNVQYAVTQPDYVEVAAKFTEPELASCPFVVNVYPCFVVAVGASCFSSSVGFSFMGRITIRSLSFRSGFNYSSSDIGMLLILSRRDF
ncbi:hypothetical protein G4O51_08565 [Candidatus Bathyarchaeota archaeon A05DMB-2]|nr:hypothetical protein [Candidatus Bathyarchaeota archaeon A05DMB-2]